MTDFASRKQQLIAKVAAVIEKGNKVLGVTLPHVDIRFDLKGRAAGMAGGTRSFWQAGATNLYVRFNVEHMMLGGQTWDHLLNSTVEHELAHSFCQAFPKHGRAHDTGWKNVCRILGGNGNRCYKQEEAPEAVAVQRPYAYTTSTGHLVAVSPIIHSKIQSGRAFTYRGKGSITKAQPFTRTQASMLAAPTTPIAPTAPIVFSTKQVPPAVRTVAPAGVSKADAIRAQIAVVKAAQGSEAFEVVVAWAVNELGMTRTLARTYVKNNWSKVG
jgi:predicted SprT family Zn-dependent metalloprotease